MAIGLSEGYAGGSLKPKIRKRFVEVTAEKKLREGNMDDEREFDKPAILNRIDIFLESTGLQGTVRR